MKALPIRYVRDVQLATRFYEALGLAVDATTRPRPNGVPGWVELRGEGAMFALHYHTSNAPPSGLELGFEATEPLESVADRLKAAGYDDDIPIVDESYGRSFKVRDPEGLEIQVSEYDRSLYT